MLSEQEYQNTKEQLQNIPDYIRGQSRANLRQRLKRKIKEHEYATNYERFEPSPHIPYFINRITSEKTLHSIIRTASSVDEYTIDTESVNVHRQGNIPALIQLQIILPNRPSVIMIIEMHHLPRENRPEFLLIKELFQIIFLQEKTSYIFGSNDELIPFTRFKLFTIEQVKSMKFIDLQKNFKRFWNEQHPHRQINSTNDKLIKKCICESCIGKDSSNSWSLQDCAAHQLNQYLSKLYSESAFDIGLDPALYRRNEMELEHRKNLSDYAFNDCLSMEIIIRQMKMQKFKFNYEEQIVNRSGLIELSPISSDDNDDDDIFAHTRIKTSRTFPITTENNNKKRNSDEHEEILLNKKKKNLNNSTETSTPSIDQIISSELNIIQEFGNINRHDNSTNQYLSLNISIADGLDQSTNQSNFNQEKLTQEQRRKIHNRSCTIKQRRRCYEHEIIRRGIDNRFTYTQIKTILREHNIPFNLLNKIKSRTTNKTTLFIGIDDPSNIQEYEQITRRLFTKEHRQEFLRRRKNQHRHKEEHRREDAQRYEDQRREHRYNDQRHEHGEYQRHEHGEYQRHEHDEYRYQHGQY